MNIFRPTTLSWKQLGVLKWAVFLIGISVGATWPEIFGEHALLIFALGLLLSAIFLPAWLKGKK